MGERAWTRAAVVGSAAVYVAGVIGGRVLPWTGTLALASLLLHVLAEPGGGGPRGARRARRSGFAALTGLAFVVDACAGGLGLSGAFADPVGPGRLALQGVLLAVGLCALAAAALRPPDRGALLGVALLAAFAVPVALAWAQPDNG